MTKELTRMIGSTPGISSQKTWMMEIWVERLVIYYRPSLPYKRKTFSNGLGWDRESGPYFRKWQDKERQEADPPIWKLRRVLELLHVRAGRVLEISRFDFSGVAPVLQKPKKKKKKKKKGRRWRKRSSEMLSSLMCQEVLRTNFHSRNTEWALLPALKQLVKPHILTLQPCVMKRSFDINKIVFWVYNFLHDDFYSANKEFFLIRFDLGSENDTVAKNNDWKEVVVTV